LCGCGNESAQEADGLQELVDVLSAVAEKQARQGRG
jgi:hypothetical protein